VQRADAEVLELKTASAAEEASTAKATDKKLDTATHPTAVVPSTPWAGSRRQSQINAPREQQSDGVLRRDAR